MNCTSDPGYSQVVNRDSDGHTQSAEKPFATRGDEGGSERGENFSLLQQRSDATWEIINYAATSLHAAGKCYEVSLSFAAKIMPAMLQTMQRNGTRSMVN